MKKHIAAIAILIGTLTALSTYGQIRSNAGPAEATPNSHSSNDGEPTSSPMHPYDPTPPPLTPGPTLHPHDYTPPPSTPGESEIHPVLTSAEAAIIPAGTPVAVGSPGMTPTKTRMIRGGNAGVTFQTPTPPPPSPGPTRFIPNPYDSQLKQANGVATGVSPYPTIPFEPTVPPRDPTTSTLKTAPVDTTSPNFEAPHVIPPVTKHAINTKGTGTDKRQVANPNGPLPTPYSEPSVPPPPTATPSVGPGNFPTSTLKAAPPQNNNGLPTPYPEFPVRHHHNPTSSALKAAHSSADGNPAPRPTPRHGHGAPIKAEPPPRSSQRATKPSRRHEPYPRPTPRHSPGTPIKIPLPPHSAQRTRGPSPTPDPR